MDSSFIEKAGGIGALGGKGTYKALAKKLRDIVGWDPLLSTAVLGGTAGALTAGEGRRVRGAMLGGGAGVLGGLAGAGLLRGTSRLRDGRRVMRQTVLDAIGRNELGHQMAAAGLGGVGAGALIQPEPVPLVNLGGPGAKPNLDVGLLTRAKEMVKDTVPGVERV